MKYLTSILCFIPFIINAQNLTFNDLDVVLSKSIVESSDYLEKKGYRIFETKSNENDNQISYIWDNNEKSNPNTSYLLITWDKTINYKMVWHQFHSLSKFNLLKNELEKMNFYLSDSYVKFESLYYTYISTDYSVSMSKGENIYTFSLKHNPDKIIRREIVPKY